MSEWLHEGKPPRFDDIREYEVWDGKDVRRVRRVGNRSMYLTPGTLVYTDCTHLLQNCICNEPEIQAWRLSERHIPSQSHQ